MTAVIARTVEQWECLECGEHTSRRHSCTVHNLSYRKVEYVHPATYQGAVEERDELRREVERLRGIIERRGTVEQLRQLDSPTTGGRTAGNKLKSPT